MILIAAPDGTLRCVYGEAVRLNTVGSLTIRRASHVEPNSDGTWTVDLSPVGGPQLENFSDRSTALNAERDWLEHHWLSV
ncbi:MAG: hypothetical protein HQ518_01525 [Rhodopirellula sp.]|nr:hypothetical protein [Rhodopirellula sp.]